MYSTYVLKYYMYIRDCIRYTVPILPNHLCSSLLPTKSFVFLPPVPPPPPRCHLLLAEVYSRKGLPVMGLPHALEGVAFCQDHHLGDIEYETKLALAHIQVCACISAFLELHAQKLFLKMYCTGNAIVVYHLWMSTLMMASILSFPPLIQLQLGFVDQCLLLLEKLSIPLYSNGQPYFVYISSSPPHLILPSTLSSPWFPLLIRPFPLGTFRISTSPGQG